MIELPGKLPGKRIFCILLIEELISGIPIKAGYPSVRFVIVTLLFTYFLKRMP